MPIEHEDQSRGQDLQASQDKCISSQQPGLPKIELEAYHEQKEDHAKF
jgi:hypothetical protein